MEKSKVYVLPDKNGVITLIDGGYSIGNIKDFTGWVLIDEGIGDRYNLCQGNYFQKPLTSDGVAYRYKLVDGKPVECTEEEIKEQEEALNQVQKATLEERVDTLETVTDDMILLMADLIGGN